MKHIFWYTLIFICGNGMVQAQKNKGQKEVYVDKKGMLRYQNSKKEAAFFGVNYTVPFAYGFRSVKSLGIDLKKEIDQDVYHFARLGLDAFRVHVWDTEISDSAGNLLENEHLDLYDYLLYKLEERNIRIIFTPLAFWGNGYPEKDENTGSFSAKYNKQQVLVNPGAIRAQENYLQQILKHVNPYTKKKYADDHYIIGLEINNEPHHSGTKKMAAEYISRMVAAVKKAGWDKPVFYNISESPAYADVVANSRIDGVSFQWYPTGLVANHSLKGNYLPNVDLYKIPFGDTISSFLNKAKLVYEFDAGDVYQSYMYPAMVRSFRQAGFQWATQFAYDPLGTAYANTEYQTHYLNLAYTPSKAISLLIAAKAFHRLPLLKNYGNYPADTLFDVFRVSYKEALSEMNSPEEFYYSNSTASSPTNISSLHHLAGVGSSPVVKYEGTGAYFLDKLAKGAWRLEVMPDAISIRDPFEKASLKKEVTRIVWQSNKMNIRLDDLSNGFEIKGINEGNEYFTKATGDSFLIQPGTYIISQNSGMNKKDYPARLGEIGMYEYVAPLPLFKHVVVNHLPVEEVTAGVSFNFLGTIAGLNESDKLTLEVRHSSNKWKSVDVHKIAAYEYATTIPGEIITPGLLQYRLIIQKATGDFFVFPGNHPGNPYAWDNAINETWQSFVAAPQTSLALFNANTDRNNLMIYNPDWRNNSISYTVGKKPGQLLLAATINKPAPKQIMAWQNFVGDKIKSRESEIASFNKVVARVRATGDESVKIKLTLLSANANAYSACITVDKQWRNIEIPLTDFIGDSSLLLPRPYPGFLSLWFSSSSTQKLNLAEIEKVEISFGYTTTTSDKPMGIELESVLLKKQ